MFLDWIKETDINLLKEEYRIIISEIGIDNFIRLIELFDKTHVYFSLNALDELKRDYVKKNMNKTPKELAKMLDCNLSYVYRIMREMKTSRNEVKLNQLNNDFNLFSEHNP